MPLALGLLQNLGELDLGTLLELLTLLAPDVMALHSEEQRQLELAPNPSSLEAATQRLVLQVATRCSSCSDVKCVLSIWT